MPCQQQTPKPVSSPRLTELFLVFLRLGCTSFGGPLAHLGYFRNAFVVQRQWLSEQAYADLLALCQILPGPASSQVGIGIGLGRGGIPGAVLAWLGFTLPSALAMTAFALLLGRHGAWGGAWLHGLKVVAVAVVAQALWGMGKSWCPDARRASIALAACAAMTLLPGTGTQIAVIVLGAALGRLLLHPVAPLPHSPFGVRLSPRTGIALLLVYAALLIVLPLAAAQGHAQGLRMFDAYFRTGALVFGGGHVVLPLLQQQVVARGWVSTDAFLAGYGAAQALPGPLFTFAAYLGAASTVAPNAWLGAAISTLAIFLPSFFLVLGVLPLWEGVRHRSGMQQALAGINAAVVGLLLAAFYDPVWIAAIHAARDFGLATTAFVLLQFWKWPPWLVVLLGALGAAVTG